MKFFRYIGYFSQLHALFGFKATSIFILMHIGNKVRPARAGKLARILVGPYVFYFPSLPYFEGLFTEIFFKGTYRLAATPAPIRAIDCGANIGVSLLYIKVRAPQARVLCFEPNPAARAVLEKNVAANGWNETVRVLPYALGKEKGTVDFFVDSDMATSSGGSLARYSKNKNKLTSYTVEVDTLSRYIDGALDFLKMDIEGAEFAVLEELAAQKKMLYIAALQLEYHYIPGFSTRPLSDLLALLATEGFRTAVLPSASTYRTDMRDGMQTAMVSAWRSK